jgi:hypothetical protein
VSYLPKPRQGFPGRIIRMILQIFDGENLFGFGNKCYLSDRQ